MFYRVSNGGSSGSYRINFSVSVSGINEVGDGAGSATNTGVIRINENGATLISGSQSVSVNYWSLAKRGYASFSITSVVPE